MGKALAPPGSVFGPHIAFSAADATSAPKVHANVTAMAARRPVGKTLLRRLTQAAAKNETEQRTNKQDREHDPADLQRRGAPVVVI